MTSPRTAREEYRIAANGADAPALERRAADHLAACGEDLRHDPSNVYRELQARCVSGACVADETVVHVDEN